MASNRRVRPFARPLRVVHAVLFGVALSVAAGSSLAAPTLAQREQARRLMDEGKERAKAGDLQRALEAYSSAHDLMHVPTTGLAVARTQLALGRLVEARATAREIVALPKADKEPPVFNEARSQAKEMESELYARIPTLKLTINGAKPTRVTVDDAVVLDAQLAEPLPLNPGIHTVVVRGAGDAEKRIGLEVKEGDVRKVTVELPSADGSPADGAAGAPSSGEQPEEDNGERSDAATAMIYGGFGVAVVGVAVGAITGAMTLSKAQALGKECEDHACAPSAKDELDSANALATVSTAAFVAAGAGVALGVVGLFMPNVQRDEDRKGGLAVHVGLTGASLSGTF